MSKSIVTGNPSIRTSNLFDLKSSRLRKYAGLQLSVLIFHTKYLTKFINLLNLLDLPPTYRGFGSRTYSNTCCL